MVGTEPLGAHGERVVKVDISGQDGGNEASVVEIDNLAGVRLHGVPLGAEDEDGLSFFDQTPAGGDDVFALVLGEQLPASTARLFRLEVSGDERPVRSERDGQPCMVCTPLDKAEALFRRAP